MFVQLRTGWTVVWTGSSVTTVVKYSWFLLACFAPWPCCVLSFLTLSSSNSTNSAQSMSSEAFWTLNTASSQFVELPELGSWSISCPVKNELSSPYFFQIRQTPRIRFVKQMFVQLRTGWTVMWTGSSVTTVVKHSWFLLACFAPWSGCVLSFLTLST